MKRIFLAMILCCLVFLGFLSAQWSPAPQQIPIVNGDFESETLVVGAPGTEQITDPGPCGTQRNWSVAGWTTVSNLGVGLIHWVCFGVNSNVLLLQGGAVEQDTGVRSQPGIYTFTFQVENRFPPYPGSWTAKIIIGNSPEELCESYGWAKYYFQTVTVTCMEPAYFVNNLPDSMTVGGQSPGTVRIHIDNLPHDGYAGWPILVDNVSPLAFTPAN